MSTWRKLGAGLLALFLAWLVLALWRPWAPGDAAQRAALARLRAPLPPLPGENGTLPFLLASRGVPEADWAAWLARPPQQAQAQLQALPAVSRPGRFDACLGANPGCLRQVRADPSGARAERTALAPWLGTLARLQARVGHVAQIGPRWPAPVFPPLQDIHRGARLDATLRVLDGEATGALADLCAHAVWLRRLHRDTDSLVARQVAGRALLGVADSHAELRALAPGTPAAAECAAAFAPLADDELSVCRVMQGEFEVGQATLAEVEARAERQDNPLRGFALRLAFDREASVALVAPAYAHWCSEAHARDRAVRAPSPPPLVACGWPQQWFNPIGCVVAPIMVPPLYDPYLRALELDGRLRLLAAEAELGRSEMRRMAPPPPGGADSRP